jgi:D-glycerate 3-kinase
MTNDASTRSGYTDGVAETVLDVVLASRARRPALSRPWLIGLSGLQGSGKSTFALQLSERARSCDIPTTILSLDDFYLGRRDRLRLANIVHPLLMTRGVPGTHDIALLMRTLDALRRAGKSDPAFVPRFDKGTDTRLPPSRWLRVSKPPRIVILEGWCVGVPAQSESQLVRAVNALERDEDARGDWRRWVNTQLADSYEPLWRRLDMLVTLEAPAFSVVTRWREEQERALWKKRAPHAMDAAMLARFLMHYERLSRHALRTLPDRADVRIILDRNRTVRAIRQA